MWIGRGKEKGELATLLAARSTRSTTFGGKILPLSLSIYMSSWDSMTVIGLRVSRGHTP